MFPDDELFMQRALDLALLGTGTTRPNPLVGCVVAHQNRIIGEGWHRQFGGPHAEVNALASVTERHLLPESTVYVTLEPCSHFGKTPPCANLLIKENVKRVVICNPDPNPLVSGRGMAKLREAGIETQAGVLEKQGRFINRRFFTFQEKKRPYILLKWAQTADGFVARPDFSSKWISGDLARKLVHKWRTEEQAILVGTNTALHDNPKLTAREWHGPQPLRVVTDRTLRLPPQLHLFDKSLPTLVYTSEEKPAEENLEFVQLKSAAENFLPHLFQDLFSRNVQSVLVEGGAGILRQLIELNLWDEARIFTSANNFGNGIPAPKAGLNYLRESQIVGEDRLDVLLKVDG